MRRAHVASADSEYRLLERSPTRRQRRGPPRLKGEKMKNFLLEAFWLVTWGIILIVALVVILVVTPVWFLIEAIKGDSPEDSYEEYKILQG